MPNLQQPSMQPALVLRTELLGSAQGVVCSIRNCWRINNALLDERLVPASIRVADYTSMRIHFRCRSIRQSEILGQNLGTKTSTAYSDFF